MNKKFLSALGLSFLISAIMIALFAHFVQGYHLSKVNSIQELFSRSANGSSANANELSSLTADKESLASTLSITQQTISKLESENKSIASDLAVYRRGGSVASSSQPSSGQNADENTNESSSTQMTNATPEHNGSFTIEEGSDSMSIARQLQEQGFISSAEEFNDLLESWGLTQYIMAGSYDLNSDMSIHDIASVITNGAYYYY